MAGRGSRLIDNQLEKIDNAAELAQVRWQARRVTLKALLASLVLTLLILALPR